MSSLKGLRKIINRIKLLMVQQKVLKIRTLKKVKSLLGQLKIQQQAIKKQRLLLHQALCLRFSLKWIQK